MSDFKRFLVTAALPYANGPVHIGHLAGVYIPADIYTRYLRQNGKDVLFICGSDEHGVPITLKARAEGITPQDVVNTYHRINKEAFREFGIAFDIYHRTSAPIHHETASAFFRKMYDQGDFIEKTSEQFFDEEHQQFLADRYITGTCPHCGNERAYGDQCEKCGTSLSPMDLKNPKSMLSGNPPVLRETRHWYLPLDKHEPWLRQWILEDHTEWRANVYGQCKSWLDQGLQPRAVSRDLDWGVPVPVEGAAGKVLYVWFDAPIGYISATKELTPDWEKYWKSEDSRMIHFIGKDNIVFHCIIFPAMLKAHGEFILPDNVPANEFLNLENDKISTSRNWAVWLHEYLEEFAGKQDVLRYVLTANAPEAKDNDFTWKDFQTRNNNELVAVLGNFINRTLVLTQKYYNGVCPATGTITDYDKSALNEIPAIRTRVEQSLEAFRIREALNEAMGLARLGNKYLAETEPWKLIKTDTARVETILNISLQITANISALLEPFLPFSMNQVRTWLNIGSLPWSSIGSQNLISAGHQMIPPGLLFEKIEDSQVEFQVNKLHETKKTNEAREAGLPEAKAAVSYDDFSRMDIRIATILEAERVPKTQKLMKLRVDTGIDVRTVISGIAEHFEPEQIIGKQITLLANLEPRTIKGIESRGMILLAEDNLGRLIFVSPDTAIQNGSIVK
ncbi:MAG: methionine--tRNA ligase [Bacteroidetes bacterium GWF2_49_14]|nr:MAG: methionine--tRNA ligase [Bacteroidetes bacterium GWF2_49_14]HBB92839.1 methionine--tRNA ligase [Bacteroidales bacterium]